MAPSELETEAGRSKGRRRGRWLLAVLCGAGLLWGGWAWWRDRHYQSAMAEIETEIMAGRYAIACRYLDRLLSWKSDPNGGLVYLLGSCELARGRTQAARAAWERVVPGSVFSERAIRGRMRLFQDSGQLAAAERLIHDDAADRRNDRTALLVSLVPMLSELGRIEEAERLIEDRWEHLNANGEGALEPAIKLLQQHIDLTGKAAPVETLRAALDRSARLAPDDDRVWLGRANLAIRTGAYDEANRWLDACQGRRPDDVPAWRARLSWAIATDRLDVAQQALKHLPAAESTPARIHRLKALFAANRGDVAAELGELERSCSLDPADVTTLARLAQLAEKDGRPTSAAEVLRKKGEVERIRARYLKLHERSQPIRDAVEMAHLAEKLGRTFEARVFLTIAISEDPDREDLRRDLGRLGRGTRDVAAPGRTLAEILADEPDRE